MCEARVHKPCHHAHVQMDLRTPCDTPQDSPASPPPQGRKDPRRGPHPQGSVAFAVAIGARAVSNKSVCVPLARGQRSVPGQCQSGPGTQRAIHHPPQFSSPPSGGLVPTPSFSHVLSLLQVRVPGEDNEVVLPFQKKKKEKEKERNSIKVHSQILGVCAITRYRLSH